MRPICQYEGCTRKTTGSHARYCAEHSTIVHICEHPGCSARKVRGHARYCALHSKLRKVAHGTGGRAARGQGDLSTRRRTTRWLRELGL